MRRRSVSVALAGALLFVSAAASHGDWLVMRDATRIETKGAWTVKGERVIFTRPNGTLASVRTSEVDLDQSALATSEARSRQEGKAPSESSEEAPPPVLVLTDREIPPLLLPAATSASGDESDEVTEPRKAWETTWRIIQPDSEGSDPDRDELTIAGSLEYKGKRTASGVTVLVRLLDGEGNQLGEKLAELTQTTLSPGEKSDFRAAFPGIASVARVELEIRSQPVSSQSS